MRFDIITIFPKIFDSYLKESLIKRALKKKIIDIRVHDLRDFAEAKHIKARREPRRTVDDSPFGGGPGMVIKIEPIWKAVKFLKSKIQNPKSKTRIRTILFSIRGKKFDSRTAKRLLKYKQLILICGRYEGVDERVAEHIADEEISIGDYVLSGGELPALVLVEAISRFLPGFLGKRESLEEIKGSYPVYTRPEIFAPPFLPSLIRANKRIRKHKKNTLSSKKGAAWQVSKILLSGDHKKIQEWRLRRRKEI